MILDTIVTGFMFATVFFALILRFAYSPVKAHHNFHSISAATNRLADWMALHDNFVFFSITALAIAVRVWNFGAIPSGFNQDGAMAAVDAKALADYGTDRFGMTYPVHFTAWGYGQMSVLLSYLMIPFIEIAGLNEITARLPILIISLCGLLALYGLIKDTFGRTTALIVFFLAAINPWHIMQSRWALDCNLFPHFFIIGCYFLKRGEKHKNSLYVSMIAFSLCMYSYGIAFLTVPLFLFLIAIYALSVKLFRLKEIFISICIYTLLSCPIWIVMIINFLQKPTIHFFSITMPFFPDSVRSGDILFFSNNFLGQLAINYNSLLNTVILQNPDAPWNALDKFGTQYLFSLPFVTLGFGYILVKTIPHYLLKNKSTNNEASGFGSFLILLGLTIGLWTGLVIASVNVNRINIIYYFMIILAGLGLAQLLKWFKPAFVVSGAIYAFSFFLFCNYYFNTWSKEIGTYFFEGMGQALKEAAKIDTPRYYVTVNSQFTGAKNVSEILTLFHHKIDAKYFQGKEFSPNDETELSSTISGNKYGISYSQRYLYINPAEMTINPDEKAVYIVTNQERYSFNQNLFKFKEFNGYVLVTPFNME